jgi:YebC/PmpR family DNA-binding regulatory protein
MSGHSKWANIKHRKQFVDAKKGALYAQLSKEISVAARLGGVDPAFNFRLRNAVDRAKAISLPSENIQRAIERYTASEGGTSNFAEVIYEGYGPAGIAVLVEAATDNRNRTAAELRTIFGKADGNLGETGCVSWGFERQGIVYLPIQQSKSLHLSEEQLMQLISELTLQDFDLESDPENFILFTHLEYFERTVSAIKLKYQCSAELAYIPETTIEINDTESINKLEKLLEKLEDNEDVQKVFHNASF